MKPVSQERHVGQYRLLADLGRGGMGRVFLAVGPDGHLVALKQILEQFTEEPDFRARFKREVDASRRVRGPYTAAVIAADPEADVPWLASELIVGPTLRQVINEHGHLSDQIVTRLAAGLVTALSAIHSERLVHRDLNPGNVLLAGDGPKVLDFGIARALDHSGTSMTRSGLIGAPGFMSPEQVDGADPAEPSDMFSLGCVLYAVSTGKNPFDGNGTLQTLLNIGRCEPDLDPVPDSLRDLVGGCLLKDPDARLTPGGALDLMGELDPSDRPWSDEIYAMIDRQRDEIARIIDGAGVAQGFDVGNVWVSDETVNWPTGPTQKFASDDEGNKTDRPTIRISHSGGTRVFVAGTGTGTAATAKQTGPSAGAKPGGATTGGKAAGGATASGSAAGAKPGGSTPGSAAGAKPGGSTGDRPTLRMGGPKQQAGDDDAGTGRGATRPGTTRATPPPKTPPGGKTTPPQTPPPKTPPGGAKPSGAKPQSPTGGQRAKPGGAQPGAGARPGKTPPGKTPPPKSPPGSAGTGTSKPAAGGTSGTGGTSSSGNRPGTSKPTASKPTASKPTTPKSSRPTIRPASATGLKTKLSGLKKRYPPGQQAGAVAVALLLGLCLLGVILDYEPADAEGQADDPTSSSWAPPPEEEDDDPEPEPDPSVFPDAVTGDCVYNYGDEDDIDLEFSDCDSGSFEVVGVTDIDDSSDCSDFGADWGVYNDFHEMRVCLDYLHSNSAYEASVNDCVFRYDEDDPWTEEGCETGVFTVLERLKGESDMDECTDSYRLDWMVYLPVDDHESLDVVLCLMMNYPDDAGHAAVDNCMAMYDTDDGRRFEFASCSDSNVYVTGRTSEPDNPGFCGNHGATWWRSNYFPELSYTVCWNWL